MRKSLKILSLLVTLAVLSSIFLSIPVTANEHLDITENVKPFRVNEITKLRSDNSQTYLLSDGSMECVIYADDKYFSDSSGELVAIDNAIIHNPLTKERSDYHYKNTSGKYNVFFSNKNNQILISTTDGDISFFPLSANKASVTIGEHKTAPIFMDTPLHGPNFISYNNVYDNVDFIYEVKNEGIKEYIVIKQPTTPNEFAFEFNIGALIATPSENGRILFTDANGKQCGMLDKLFACDANGAYTEDLSYSLRNENGRLIINVSISKEYLQHEDRVYPVIIDPSYMVTGESDTYDACVVSAYPNTNYYVNNYLRTGKDVDFGTRRSYIKFLLPSFLQGKQDAVTSVYLDLKHDGGVAPSVKAYRVTQSWASSTVTWNNKPAYTTANASTTTVAIENNWYRANVTEVVKLWLSGTANNGFLLKDLTESDSTHWTTFFSSDAASPNKPELHIYYNENKYMANRYSSNVIYLQSYSYTDTWQTALDQSRSNWNNSGAGVIINTSTGSPNVVDASAQDYSSYGRMIRGDLNSYGLYSQFTIELNAARIRADCGSYLSNFIQSVFVHELGHVMGLQDNPITPYASIMSYSRDRKSMTTPSSYDAENVRAKYG